MGERSGAGGGVKRASWDPAFSDQSKVEVQGLVGSLVDESQVLELALVPAPTGPLFYDRLVLHLSDGAKGRWTLNFGEFKPSKRAGELSRGVAYFRVDSAASAASLTQQFGAWLGVTLPSFELANDEDGGSASYIPIQCAYLGLEAHEDGERWEDFIFELGTSFELSFGLRLWRSAHRVQFFLPHDRPAWADPLGFVFAHMIWAKRLRLAHDAVDATEGTLRVEAQLEGLCPGMVFGLEQGSARLWALGAPSDGEGDADDEDAEDAEEVLGAQLLCVSLAAGDDEVRAAQVMWQHDALWVEACSVNVTGCWALLIGYDEDTQCQRIFRFELGDRVGVEELSWPELELEQMSVALSACGSRCAVAQGGEVFVVDMSGEVLWTCPPLEGVEDVWDWHEGRGIQAIVEDEDGLSLGFYWRPGELAWRGGAGISESPCGDHRVEASSLGLEFSARDEAGRFVRAGRWDYQCFADLEAWSQAQLWPAESTRWCGARFLLYTRPWLLLSSEGNASALLAADETPREDGVFVELVAFEDGVGVVVDSCGEYYLVRS